MGGIGARAFDLKKESIPNLLTWSRLALVPVFVVLVAMYRFPEHNAWALLAGAIVFVIASLTDAADGYLARRWNAVSAFGRVMDPVADKALVLGAFVMLCGPNFANSDGDLVTRVAPWMVVVIIARELLVTSIRSVMESSGVEFGAVWAGKLKMILQSIVVPIVLLLIWFEPRGATIDGWQQTVIALLVWATVIATVVSGVPYVTKALSARAGAS